MKLDSKYDSKVRVFFSFSSILSLVLLVIIPILIFFFVLVVFMVVFVSCALTLVHDGPNICLVHFGPFFPNYLFCDFSVHDVR